MNGQKQELSIEYCWNVQTELALHSWATLSQKNLHFAWNSQVVYFTEIVWKLNNHSSEEHSDVHSFSLSLQLHQDNLLVLPSKFPKEDLEACFRFYQFNQNHYPSPSVPRLKYLASGVSYNDAKSIASTNLRSENIIFHLDSLFQNQPPYSGENMTTPLKTRRYYTGHIRIFR